MDDALSRSGALMTDDTAPPSTPSFALAVLMPRISALMRAAMVHRVCVHVGDRVRPGQALFEVRVDLSDGSAQDRPPVSYY
ncbi:MAG: hypothetical protein H0W83_13665, partial [Planctomycetes bacterium]|nr:hypothetical protein [Planctomycetota bacterium]